MLLAGATQARYNVSRRARTLHRSGVFTPALHDVLALWCERVVRPWQPPSAKSTPENKLAWPGKCRRTSRRTGMMRGSEQALSVLIALASGMPSASVCSSQGVESNGHASLRAYGMAICQLPDLVCTGQVGGLRRDPRAGNDR